MPRKSTRPKNKAAAALSKLRWAKLTPEQRSAEASRVGKATWANMTPEEIGQEIRRRWARRKARLAAAAVRGAKKPGTLEEAS